LGHRFRPLLGRPGNCSRFAGPFSIPTGSGDFLTLQIRRARSTGRAMAGAQVLVRDVTQNDAAAIAAIYAHHVVHGTASYDTEPPPPAEWAGKIRRITAEGWPFLVAEADEAIVAYAYATRFRDRAAYRFTAENSIYVHPERVGRGIGKAVLLALIERAEAFGFQQMIAVIGGAEPASIALHSACGFAEVGRLSKVGWKHERWLDSVYMQLALSGAAVAG
jgi:phosphinothricin acetyltransferase